MSYINPVQITHSTVASSVPTSGQLLVGSLAVNVKDAALFTKREDGTVVRIESPPAADMVTLNAVQTLTNKTLTAPVINSPTGIVKGDVGLSNVDNTSDAAKPVSTAQSTAIGLKISTTAKDATGGVPGLTLFKINFKNAANTFTNFFTNATTAARTYTFPDKNITVAGLADITGTNSGTNTGDNAVNTLYSGLVSNATHTGDATGSTALTVVKINGTSLAGLATGLLKNTTTTGVPSIAVAGTDYQSAQSVTGLVKSSGTTRSAAVVRTDYAEPTAALATGILKNTTTTGAHTIAVAADFPTLNQSTTGNAATVTTNANLTGEVTSVGNTATVPNATVIGKVLTGYVSGAGTVAATDTILQAINKLNGNVAGKQAAGTYATGSGTASGTNTGDQTITLTGDVTGTGSGSFAATIAAGSVTLAKQANMATASVVYRKTAGSGAPEVQTLATLKTDLVLVKGDVGLGSADNTSDANKPVSTAQQAALDLKAAISQPAWTTATYQNSWAPTSAGNDARYFKTTTGMVNLVGSVKAGTAGAMFTLPAGCRPLVTLYALGINGNTGAAAYFSVDASGVVSSSVSGSGAIFHICQFQFRAEA